MPIHELPPFLPRLEDERAEEFLAHSHALLDFPIEIDLGEWEKSFFQVSPPSPAPEPPLPFLAPIWFPKPAPEVVARAGEAVKPPRPVGFLPLGDLSERVLRPLLAGQGPIMLQGEAGSGKSTWLTHLANHEKTRGRFRRVWYFDQPERVGQIAALLLGAAGLLAQNDPYAQLAGLGNLLDDDTLLVIDNLTPDHPFLLACQSLSPFVLLGVETPPPDTEALPRLDPTGTFTLRRWTPDESLDYLANALGVSERKGLSRDVRPLLQALAERAAGHPLALSILGAFLRGEGLAPADLLAALPTGESPQAILALAVESLPAEGRKLLEVMSAFSPLGTPREALEALAAPRAPLGLTLGLGLLRRRGLAAPSPTEPNLWRLPSHLYRFLSADAPHRAGKSLGERVRGWLGQTLADAAYHPPVLFALEGQLRFWLATLQAHKLPAPNLKASAALSDYLRTYAPNLLPFDAPPPRLMGERAAAIQAGRAALDRALAGDVAGARGQVSEALNALQTLGSEHDQAEIWVISAHVEAQAGDLPKAIQALEKAAKLVYELNVPESLSTVRLALAMLYRRVGRLKDALAVLDDTPQAEAERARCYRALGNYPAMLSAMEKTTEFSPYARAESLLQAEAYAEALSALAEDNSPDALYLHALIYHLQGDLETALKGYAAALTHYAQDDPQRALPARAMAAIHIAQGDEASAESVLQTLINDLKNSSPALECGRSLMWLAALHLRQGNNRTAVETIHQALPKLGKDAPHADLAKAYHILGRANWRLGRHDEALKAFSQALDHAQSTEPRDEWGIGVSFFLTGEVARLTGETDRALGCYRRALSHIPPRRDPHAYFMVQAALHRLFAELGREAEALQTLEAALEHLDRFPPPNLLHLGGVLVRLVRLYQRRGAGGQAYKYFARWLNTLAGRADALDTPEQPQLAILALALATRSLLLLGRQAEALPLAEEALALGEKALKLTLHAPLLRALRRDYGQALILAEQWQMAHAVLLPLMREEAQDDPLTYPEAAENFGYALYRLGDYKRALSAYGSALDKQANRHRQALLFERMAHAHVSLGDTPSAVENFHEAMKLIERKSQPLIAARILTSLAHTLAGANRYADAVAVYQDALALLYEVPESEALPKVRVLASLARSSELQGQLFDAAQSYKRALNLIDAQALNMPDDHRLILLRLARVLVKQEDYRAALPYFERARELAQNWGTRREVGVLCRELADAQRLSGDIALSLASYQDSLELLPNDDEHRADRAQSLRHYGQALALGAQYAEARRIWEEALALASDLSPQEVALTHHAIGQVARTQNDFPAALEAFQRALATYPKGNSEELAATARELGELYLAQGQMDEALAQLQNALEIERALPQQSNARLIHLLNRLASLEEGRGRLTQAMTHYHSALVYMDRTHQAALVADTLRKLGLLYVQAQDWENAQKAFHEALELEMGLKPRQDERVGELLRHSAEAYRAEGKLDKAASTYKRLAQYANLTQSDAQALKSTLGEIEKHKATLRVAQESLSVLEKTAAELKQFVFVYALLVRTHYHLGEFEQSRAMMERLVKLLNAQGDALATEDPRSDYRALAHLRAALQYEKQKDHDTARAHYQAALAETSDGALAWLIEQSMGAVV